MKLRTFLWEKLGFAGDFNVISRIQILVGWVIIGFDIKEKSAFHVRFMLYRTVRLNQIRECYDILIHGEKYIAVRAT